jgi:NAD-dependent SIR2 family protein deacetylase
MLCYVIPNLIVITEFAVRSARYVFNHVTGRLCDDPSCKGQLMDSIVNFGENLPDHELQKAFMHAKQVSSQIVSVPL